MNLAHWPSWTWPIYVLRCEVRATWRGLPGPWYVKAALLALCLAIPGPQDEIALLAITALCRAIRARRTVN